MSEFKRIDNILPKYVLTAVYCLFELNNTELIKLWSLLADVIRSVIASAHISSSVGDFCRTHPEAALTIQCPVTEKTLASLQYDTNALHQHNKPADSCSAFEHQLPNLLSSERVYKRFDFFSVKISMSATIFIITKRLNSEKRICQVRIKHLSIESLHIPFHLWPQALLSFKHGNDQFTPFLLHIIWMMTRGQLNTSKLDPHLSDTPQAHNLYNTVHHRSTTLQF